MSFDTAAIVLAWVAILLLAFVVAGLIRQVHGLMEGAQSPGLVPGPRSGSPAPPIPSIGESWSNPALVVFVDDDCESCRDLLPEFVRIARSGPDDWDYVAAFAHASGGFAENGVAVIENQDRLFRSYRVPATPFAVLISADGLVVASQLIGSPDALVQFLQSITGRVS